MSLLLLLRSLPLVPTKAINRRVDHEEGDTAIVAAGSRALESTLSGARVGETTGTTGVRTL